MLHIKEFREEHGIYASQVVEVVRERYPGYDKYLNSKVENPEKYGIRLVSDAEQMLENAFQRTLSAPRRPDRRRLPSRISAGCQRRCLTSCNRRSAPLALTPCRPACNI